MQLDEMITLVRHVQKLKCETQTIDGYSVFSGHLCPRKMNTASVRN
jgi:hypothetical protein